MTTISITKKPMSTIVVFIIIRILVIVTMPKILTNITVALWVFLPIRIPL